MPAPDSTAAPATAPIGSAPPNSPVRSVVLWVFLLGSVAVATGSLVALFLWALDRATAIRWEAPWLLWGLPATGALVAWGYARAGRGVDRGNNLIIDEIHEPGGGVPARLAPLVLIGTLGTHLFGGSAGREGTAVQMGGALASAVERHLLARLPWARALSASERSMLLQAGVAAGFAAVFGTPLAGTLFALEVLRVGRLSLRALVPCLIAALLADRVTLAWGIHHTPYPAIALAPADHTLHLLGAVVLLALAAGVVSRGFATGTHAIGNALTKTIARVWLRPVIGGLCVIALTYAVGTRDYLGLGVTSPDAHAVTIVSAFREGGATPWSWLHKAIFTAVTIGSGFKGGEVTPLFYIGATLGNALATVLHAPVMLFAAIGFVAVFAGATNTPLACTVMAIELFGPGAAPYFAAGCLIAFLVSGPTGVYTAQRARRAPAAQTTGQP